ncbi:barstar family protein [Streptomyces sp. NPDC007903]|uniref:barstar family protein n=1 Tax=Streptomyces sp. NPDC007903 TaxID=3364786 RepID=UPI0036E26C0C
MKTSEEGGRLHGCSSMRAGDEQPEVKACPVVIILDVSGLPDERALHLLLQRELGFPDFYGRNWAAFWDAITGLVWIPDHLRFLGWEQLAEEVPDGAAMLRRALDNYRARYRPELVVEFE